MKLLKKLAALFAATTALALTSCDNLGFDANSFQNKVGSYFLEMTSSAAIALFEVTPDDTVKNKYGVDCVPATGDHVVSFTLRNPQKYHFTLHNNMECSVGGLIIGEAEGVSIAQDPDDTAKINITYSSTYLLNHPLGDDISPTVELFHPVSHASFGVFDKMKISSDSPPPSVQLACFQRDNNGTFTGTDYTSDDHYVICFYLPKISQFADSYHGSKTDVHTFYINGTKKYIKASDGTIWNSASVDETGDWTFTDQDTSISGSRPTTLEALNPGGFEFLGTGTGDEAEYDGLYEARYMTLSDKTIDEYGPDTITYNFTMEDDAGLSSSLATSNKASRLNAPLLQDPSGDPISDGTVATADEETGFYTLRIVHDGKDEDGNACGAVNINYTIQRTSGSASFGDDTTHTLRGTAAGSASIKLPGRCTFKIQATASKNYYITSLKTEATGVKVTQPAVFYVSQSGEDEGGTGARGTPFRTIKKALDTFTDSSSGYSLSEGCKVYVMSDLTVPDESKYMTYKSSNSPSDPYKNAMASVTFDADVIIQGYGGTWTLDASGNGTDQRSCVAVTNGKLILQNINVTGAFANNRHDSSHGYAGVFIGGGGSKTRLEYKNGRVYGVKKAPAASVYVANTYAVFENVRFENSLASPDDCYYSGVALDVGGNSSKATCTNCDFVDNGALGQASVGETTGGAIHVTGTGSGAQFVMTGGSIKGTKASTSGAGSTKGGAIYVGGGSATLTNVEISGTRGAKLGGAIYCDSGTLSLKSCTIKDNSADKYGAIYCGGALILESTTITGNHADSKCAGVFSDGTTTGVSLQGKNTIYNNYITGTTTQSNLTMPLKVIDINLDTDGFYESLIGINVDLTTGHNEPTVGHPVVFTNGYDYSEGDDYPPKPGVVFKSENGYGIAPSGIEAAFAVSSASSYNATDYTFTPTLMADCAPSVYPGATKTFVINDLIGKRKEPAGDPSDIYFKVKERTLYTKSGTPATNVPDPTGKTVSITAALYSGGTKVRDATVDSSDSSRITLVAKTAGDAAILPPNNYTLKVIVEFLGAKHEANIPIAIDYSAETVADYINGLTTTGNYSVKVVGTVGPRMDYASTTITTGDDGLAKVAKAIKRAASGVMISLDARETNYVPADGDPDADDYNPLANYNNNSYFAGCANLKKIYLPDWLQYIVARQDGSDVIGLFEGCSGLTKVELSSNVKLVMYNAFKGCSSLARISLSEKISEPNSSDDPRGIQEGAFVGCAEGFKIDFAGTKEQWKKVSRPNQTTNDWHDGAKEESADDGSVQCTDGKCGFDYKDVTALSIPLTLEAVESSVTVTFDNKASGSVFFKINGGAEQNILANQSKNITLEAIGDKVEFFGNNETYTSSDSYSSKISCDADCYVYGNVMSLVDKDNFETNVTLTGEGTFDSLFRDNTHIKNHPSKDLLLPATTLQWTCYRMMFRGCKNLERAPNLPAETLQYASYQYMFRDCQKLVTPPVISATTVAGQCCEAMFQGCTSLTTAPALPATDLSPASQCYLYMFQDCTSLTTAPALPATTLGETCYKMMFAGCTSLTTAPELPAATLERWCYKQMFQGCTSLHSVTCRAEDISPEDCVTNWLEGTTGGVLTGALTPVQWGSQVPSGWTIVIE